MKKEIFKAVQGYEHLYEVSSLGRVKSLPRLRTWGNRTYLTQERFIKLSKNKSGYFTLNLCGGIEKKNWYIDVHRLVAMAFLERKRGFDIVNHIDLDKTNNKVENLEWVNKRENNSHAVSLRPRSTVTQYRYVCKADNKTNPFAARIKIKGKIVHLGCYPTALDAYKVAIKFRNDNGIVNKYS